MRSWRCLQQIQGEKMQLISALILSLAWGAPTSLEKFCQGKLKAHEFSKQSISDCKLAGALAASDEVQHFAREKMAQKMIEQSAKLIKEQLQSLALTDQLFFQNGINLPANSCRLEAIAPQKFGCDVNKDRLEMFQKALGVNKGSLRNNLAALYKQNLGAHEGKSCPLSGDGQGYLLKAQLDDESFDFFVHLKTDNNFDKEVFNRHPLLGYLSENERTLFLDYVKNLDQRKSNKDLVLTFFQKHHQLKVGDAMASDCDKMSKSVVSIVCDKIPAPVSLDPKVNNELFKFDSSSPSLDDQMEEGDDTYLGFALYCKHLNSCKNSGSCDDSTSEFDKNYLTVKSSLRNISTDQLGQDANEFCKYYSCQEESIKNTTSCKKGGPLSLADFKATFQCPDGNSCNGNRKSMYAFFKNLEREQTRVAEWKKNHSGGTTTAASGSTGPRPNLYSDFSENFLGVEETIKAEGRPVTAKAIEEKTQNFKERGLASAQSSGPASGKVSQSTAQNEVPSNNIGPKGGNAFNNVAPSSFTAPTNDSPVTTQIPSSSVTPKSVSQLDPEAKRMREELEKMIGDLKGTNKDKLSAIADNNSSFIPEAQGGLGGMQGLSRDERSRVEDLKRRISELESGRTSGQGRTGSNITDAAFEEQKRIAEEAMKNRPKDDDFGIDPKAVAAENERLALAKSGGSASAKGDKRGPGSQGESVQVEKMVKAEDLPKLSLEELKKLGISEKDETFVLKVIHGDRIVEIPVKKFKIEGSRYIFAPIITEKNQVLSDLILRGPVFQEYREFQANRVRYRRDML